MRLIDIDPINKDLTLKKRVLTAKYGEYAAEDGSYMSWREIFELVNRQPEVDAVRVVRCGKCKWSRVQQDGNMVCIRIPLAVFTTMEERFCFDGERKEDE